MTNKTAALFSAGIDSIVMAQLLHEAGSLGPLFLVNYGQASFNEQYRLSVTYSRRWQVPLIPLHFDYADFMPLDVLKTMHSFHTGYVPPIAQHRDTLDASADLSDADSGVWSWVNGRNAVFMLMAAIQASYMGCDKLAYGLQMNHYDLDENTQPESRRGNDTNVQLVDKMNAVIYQSFGRPFKIVTPLIGFSKPEVIRIGKRLGLDLSVSYSCEYYAPTEDNPRGQCGRCTQCTDVMQASIDAEVLR